MIAGCLNTINDFAIASMRLTLVWAALSVIWVAARNLYRSRLGLIPKPLWYFTATWAAIMAVTASASLFTCAPIQSGWFVVIYGSSFTWTIVGLLWVIVTAERLMRKAVHKATEYSEAVDRLIESDLEQ